MSGATEKLRLLTIDELAELLCMTTRTIRRLVSTGQLPKPIRFGHRTVRWRAEDVHALLQSSK